MVHVLRAVTGLLGRHCVTKDHAIDMCLRLHDALYCTADARSTKKSKSRSVKRVGSMVNVLLISSHQYLSILSRTGGKIREDRNLISKMLCLVPPHSVSITPKSSRGKIHSRSRVKENHPIPI